MLGTAMIIAACACIAIALSRIGGPRLKRALAPLAMNDTAALNLSGGISFALGLVGSILAGMLALIVVAALFGDYTTAVRNINENLTTADFGDSTTNSIAPIFAIVVGVSALAGLVGIVVYAVVRK